MALAACLLTLAAQAAPSIPAPPTAQEDRRAEAAGDSWNGSSFHTCLAGEAMRITGEAVLEPSTHAAWRAVTTGKSMSVFATSLM